MERKYARNNSPSPTSYEKGDALEATLNKAGSVFKISPTKKTMFLDGLQAKQKTLPGVGKYDPHKSMDLCYKPMRKY